MSFSSVGPPVRPTGSLRPSLLTLRSLAGPNSSRGVEQAVSLGFQRSEHGAEEYYGLALDILGGDAEALLTLVGRLPDEGKRDEVRAVHRRRRIDSSKSSADRDAASRPGAADHEADLDASRGLSDADEEGRDRTLEAAASRARSLQWSGDTAGWRLPPSTEQRVEGATPADAPARGVPPRTSPGAAFAAGARVDAPSVGQKASWRSPSARPPAAASDVMASLQEDLDEEEDDLCPVCLVTPPSVACDPCGHALCGECVDLWRQTSASYYAAAKSGSAASKTTCPMCRAEILGFRRAHESDRATGRLSKGSRPSAPGTSEVIDATDAAVEGKAKKKASRGQRWRLKKRAAAATGDAAAAASEADGPVTYGGFGGYGDSWGGGEDASSRRAASPGDAAPIIVWFRQDLRLRDNPALHAAAASGAPIVPVFIWCPAEEGNWPLGGAARYWLHHALAALDASLRERYGSKLVIRSATGPGAASSSLSELSAIAEAVRATAVYANRVYEPWKVARDAEAETTLASEGVRFRSFNGVVLYEPWDAAPDETDDACWNSGYGSVRFFLRACAKLGEPPAPLPAPANLKTVGRGNWPRSLRVEDLDLARLPRKKGRVVDWAAGIRAAWRFGEEGAAASLDEFLAEGLERFDAKHAHVDARNTFDAGGHKGGRGSGGGGTKREGPAPATERFRADVRTTARISPYMRFGELSPREVYHAAKAASGGASGQRSASRSAAVFLRRLAWRDLAYWSLWRFPRLADDPLRPQYEHQWWAVPWDPRPSPSGRGDSTVAALSVTRRRWDSFMTASDDPKLRAWQRGETGYPLVDAAMRELWVTGYIPNYMRHVVAGFLIEFLSIDWRHGELWFHDTLVDADVAIQGFMWQNGGHSGMDQWNFVMHPVFAAKSADPEGEYVRRWCPELAKLPREYIHCPWEAPATMLARAGVAFGRDYPRRIVVNLDEARRISLKAVLDVRRGPGAKYILPDGNEALPLPEPGRVARCITRVDYRAMSEEPLTKQTAAAPWDISRRARRDPLSVALDECAALSERRAVSAMSVLG